MNRLADWVVEEQLVSPAQLEQARRHQQDNGAPLATALIELSLLDEGVLVDLLSRRHELPKAPRRLHRMTIASKALSAIPQDYCWQHGMFPFGFDPGSRKLQVAIGDPADAEALALLKKIAREVLLYVAGPKQLEKAIRKHYLDSWVDDSQANAKPLRFFGYENITSPGTKIPTRGGEPDAALRATPRTTSPLAELAMAVPPEVEVLGHAAATTADARAAAPADDSLPIAVDSPAPQRTPTPPLMLAVPPSPLHRTSTPPPVSTDRLPRALTPPPVPTEGLRRTLTPPPVSTEGLRRTLTPPPVSTDGPRRTTPPLAMEALQRSPTEADPLLRSPTPSAAVVGDAPGHAVAEGDPPLAVQLGKLQQPVDRVGELQLRVEVLERAVAELLAVIGVGAQESSTRLAKISLDLRRSAERKIPPK